MLDNNAIVARFVQQTKADEALKQMQEAGFDMKKVSIMADTEEKVGSGKYMLVVNGTPDDIIRAREILSATQAAEPQSPKPEGSIAVGLAGLNLAL